MRWLLRRLTDPVEAAKTLATLVVTCLLFGVPLLLLLNGVSPGWSLASLTALFVLMVIVALCSEWLCLKHGKATWWHSDYPELRDIDPNEPLVNAVIVAVVFVLVAGVITVLRFIF